LPNCKNLTFPIKWVAGHTHSNLLCSMTKPFTTPFTAVSTPHPMPSPTGRQTLRAPAINSLHAFLAACCCMTSPYLYLCPFTHCYPLTECESNEWELWSALSNLLFIRCTGVWVIRWPRYFHHCIFTIAINSTHLTDCIILIVRILQKWCRCFRFAHYTQADLGNCVAVSLFQDVVGLSTQNSVTP